MKRGVKKQSPGLGSIRIISGQWRGRKLPVLDAQGLRPTTDRTKETVFNWLMPYINDRVCLDAFAGSGSLGFEALSRHAKSVDFIEKDPQASRQLQANCQTLGIDEHRANVVQGEMQQILPKLQQHYDLVFLDPPFGFGLVPLAIDVLVKQRKLNHNALVYVECEISQAGYTPPSNWLRIKDKSSGQVSACLYQVNENSQVIAQEG